MDDESIFTKRLNLLMKARKINQVRLCELTGLSSAQANYLANGKTKDPKLSTACKIALALDVSLDYLAGLIDEPLPIQRDENGMPVLTADETTLIGLYRDTDERGQRSIIHTAQDQADALDRGGAGQTSSPQSPARRIA